MSLPKGYKRLEYIQSSGTQYIDSGFKANQNSRIVMDCKFTTIDSGGSFPFGARNTGLKEGFNVALTPTQAFYHYGSPYQFVNHSDVYSRMVIDANKNVATFTTSNKSATITLATATFTTPQNVLLGTCYEGSTVLASKLIGEIYSCQIYDNGTLVRDYIPCQNASGAVGLWDDANGVFYGNAGSGAFAVGPIIQAPDKPSGLAHALSVRLVWSAVSGAASYNIYRDGAFVGSSNTPTFVDVSAAENQTYVYAVSAVGQGGEGEPATLTVYTKAGYFEYKPLIESANFQ